MVAITPIGTHGVPYVAYSSNNVPLFAETAETRAAQLAASASMALS